MDSKASSSDPATSDRSQPGTGPTYRLVIRAHIIPESPVVAAPRRSYRRPLTYAFSAVALVTLIWAGFQISRHDAAEHETARNVQPQAPERPTAPPEAAASPPSNAGSASTSLPLDDQSQPAAQQPESPSSPPVPVDQVIPQASASALQTIHGTIRVAVRVTVDADGKVTAATAEIPGPSRYFERLSVEAARKWTFTPARQDHRTRLLRFNFTREGATASSD